MTSGRKAGAWGALGCAALATAIVLGASAATAAGKRGATSSAGMGIATRDGGSRIPPRVS